MFRRVAGIPDRVTWAIELYRRGALAEEGAAAVAGMNRREFVTLLAVTGAATVGLAGDGPPPRRGGDRVVPETHERQRVRCLYNGYLLTANPRRALSADGAADRHVLFVLHAVLIDPQRGRVAATFPVLNAAGDQRGARPVADYAELTNESPAPPGVNLVQLFEPVELASLGVAQGGASWQLQLVAGPETDAVLDLQPPFHVDAVVEAAGDTLFVPFQVEVVDSIGSILQGVPLLSALAQIALEADPLRVEPFFRPIPPLVSDQDWQSALAYAGSGADDNSTGYGRWDPRRPLPVHRSRWILRTGSTRLGPSPCTARRTTWCTGSTRRSV